MIARKNSEFSMIALSFVGFGVHILSAGICKALLH